MYEDRNKKREEKKKIKLYGSSTIQNPSIFKESRKKEEEKRGERGRKYNCMAAVYAGSPNSSLTCIFSWQNAANTAFSRDEECKNGEKKKKKDAVHAAVPINLLRLERLWKRKRL